MIEVYQSGPSIFTERTLFLFFWGHDPGVPGEWLGLSQPDFGGTLGPSAPHSARSGGDGSVGGEIPIAMK